MAPLLADHRALRLVVLNACEGSQGSQRDLFSSTSATLAQQGILAILAMQYAISDHAAIECTRTFYEALAEGLPVDEAVTEGRRAISIEYSSLEWGTPVLHLRAPDGVLFNIEERTGLQEKESSKDLTSKVEPSGQTGEVTGPSRIGSANNTGSLRTRGQRQWDASTFFAELERRRGDEEARVAWKILDWAAQRKLRIWWGKGLQDGSFFPMLDHDNGVYWTVAIWTYGRVEIQFQWMLTTPAFASEATRLELLRRLNHLPGVRLSPIVITKRPAFPLSTLKDEAALNLFLQTLDWIVQLVRVGVHENTNAAMQRPKERNPELEISTASHSLSTQQVEGRFEEGSESVAQKVLEVIKETSFIKIDTAPLLGEKGGIREVAFDRFSSISELLDSIYSSLVPHVRPFTYEKSWLIREVHTGKVFLNIGTNWATKAGRELVSCQVCK